MPKKRRKRRKHLSKKLFVRRAVYRDRKGRFTRKRKNARRSYLIFSRATHRFISKKDRLSLISYEKIQKLFKKASSKFEAEAVENRYLEFLKALVEAGLIASTSL